MIYIGVVEERSSDPLKIGRCKVRIFGLHSEDKTALPTSDLPWAYPITSVTSASFGGIGTSPTGLIEGSWVVITFGDEFKQQPIILGSLIGIPVSEPQIDSPRSVDPVIHLVDSDNNTVTDSEGNPVGTESNGSNSDEIKPAANLSLSDVGRKFIHQEESLSSIERGKNKIAPKNISDSTQIFAYRDKEFWSIGWGSRYLSNGSEVNEGTTLTKAECDALFELKLKTEFEAGIKRNLSVPVTQSMYDSLVSMSYNMGVSGLVRSEMFKELNAGRYDVAYSLIPSTRSNGLAGRRSREQTLFGTDGLPSKDGQTLEKTPATKLAEASTPTPENNIGFGDASGKYPKRRDEQDSHRLTRRESESSTILKFKEAARAKGVKLPNGKTWTQPKIPYAASYPYNHLRSTESGHLEEFDDTPGAERIHRYHRSGTYEEIDSNGTRVNRIVGDSYSILERNGHVYVKGNVAITVIGDADIRVENDLNIDVLGNMTTKVAGEYVLTAQKGMKFKTDGSLNSQAKNKITQEGEEIHLNSGFTVDAKFITEEAAGRQEFAPLTVVNRHTELNATYESPEEGSNSSFNKKHSEKFDVEDVTPASPSSESVSVAQKPIVASNVACDQLKDSDITPGYKLSPLFVLSDLLSRGKSGYPKGTNYGLSSAEIVCNLKNLTVNCLDLIKAKYPNMIITSAWRSQAYNAHIGGSKTSDHLFGCAVDIQFPGFTRRQYYDAVQDIQKFVPTFKQLILEYKGSSTWIHISYRDGKNSNQCLTIDAASNKTLKSGGFVLA